jgi:hypothetical protein
MMMFLVVFGTKILGYGTILFAFIVSWRLRLWSVFFLRVFAVAACVYLFSVILNFSYGVMLDYCASTFDLNADGVFSKEEFTHDLSIINTKIVQDTGRTFYPITGIFLSLFISIFFLTTFSIYHYLKLKVTHIIQSKKSP